MEYDEITEIESWEQLKKIRFDSDRHFKLVSDINLEQESGVQIYKFRGILDGNGHEIKNIHSNCDENMPSLINTNQGIIKNLHFKGIDICYDEALVGGICIHNHGKIINCSVEGNLESERRHVGGICTYSTGKVIGCEFEGNINSNDSQAGGIAAINKDHIKNCKVKNSNIKGEMCSGGISGDNHGLVKNCHSFGSIRSDRYSGGIVGYNFVSSKVQKSSSKVEVSSDSVLGGLSGVNEGEIKDCYFQGDVSKPIVDNGDVGLLVGTNNGVLVNCYWETGIEEYLEPTGSNGSGKTKLIGGKGDLKGIESSIIANKI